MHRPHVNDEMIRFNFAGIEAEYVFFVREIIVSNQFEEGFSDAVGACYGDTEEIVVELARKDWDGQKTEILKTLAHEMIHVRQCAKGEYMYENPARKHEGFLFDLVMERLV